MNLSQWAEQQVSIAQLYRNLSQENPVTLTIVSGGQSFSVHVAYTEPGFDVPFNVVWICAGGQFEGAVLRRVSDKPFAPFRSEWIELETLNDVFAEAPYFRSQELLLGEVERFSVGPASTNQAGIFRITKGKRVVPTTAKQLYDARKPLDHEHDPEPNRYMSVGDLLIDMGESKPPKAGDVLVITRVDETGVKGEWIQLDETDILYDGPWPVSMTLNGPTGPVDEMMQVQFTADLHFEDGSTKRINPIWELSRPVGTVDETGVFRSQNVDGDIVVNVSARYFHEPTESSFTNSFTMMVKDIDSFLIFESLELRGPLKVDKAATATYSAFAVFNNGSKVPVSPDYWRVANSDAGSITANGVFTAAKVIGSQETKITAMYTHKGITKQALLEILVVDTTIYPSSASIVGPDTVDENTSAKFELEITYSNGRKQTVAVSDWAHSNPEAGKIDRLSGKFVVPDLDDNAQTTITASYTLDGLTIGARKDIFVIDTTVYPQRIDIIGPDIVVEGRSAEYEAVVYLTDGTYDNRIIAWSMDPTTAAEIGYASGILRAASDVESDTPVTIRTDFTFNGKKVEASKVVKIRSTTNLPEIASISAPSSMKVGETASLVFVVRYLDGTTARVRPLWELSNSNIASITSDGLLTAKQVSEASVITVKGTYSASGVTVTANVSVTLNDTIARPLSAQVSGPDSVKSTNTAQFALDVKFSDGATRRVPAMWQSSDRSVGVIDSSGIFRPYSVGKTILTGVYTSQGQTVSDTHEINVI